MLIMKFQLARKNKNILKAPKNKEEAIFIGPEIKMTSRLLSSNIGG